MAAVLCTGIDPSLLETCKFMLEGAGHTVTTATNRQAVIAACETTKCQVAVIGHAVSPNNKRLISSLVREHCPDAKVLELYRPHEGRTIPDADSWLEVPADVPQQLVEFVDSLAAGKRQGKARS